MKIIACGDIHAEWNQLNNMINKQNPDIILQCGDYGWWPHGHGKYFFNKRKKFNQFGVKPGNTKIYWCPGNHENWDDLNCISKDEIVEIQDNVFYCPFGSTLELPTGEMVLFVGGADSIDRAYRTEGMSWWKDEIISNDEMDRLPDCKIDIVVSHTVPRRWIEFLLGMRSVDTMDGKFRDPSTIALQIVFDKYKPSKWYSGHFHAYKKLHLEGCDWTSLSMTGLSNWWEEV